MNQLSVIAAAALIISTFSTPSSFSPSVARVRPAMATDSTLRQSPGMQAIVIHSSKVRQHGQ
jgi:hypothetical protein